MEGQKYFRETAPADMVRMDDLPVFAAARDWLDRYFAGQRPQPSELPLSPEGSSFRKAVWEILCAIPYGEVTTYGRIASLMAAQMNKASMSCQAVGGAVAHNPIAIIIPCHRVVGTDGSLTGYAGGIDRKARLLEHEGVDMARGPLRRPCLSLPS
jgi:methylated-DNA-[protein]-cysteine S-methyltransferase